jgi:hypothetical protein
MVELLIVVVAIAAFDMVAVRWGADSRAAGRTDETRELMGGRR